MKYGSVCSGIEAASVAWHSLGWHPAWFAEIEKFPSQVLAHRFPDVKNLGDMTQIRGMIGRGEVDAPDVLVGGTPCQAFSVAGLRKSLDDERGQLSLEFVRLADEIDKRRTAAGSVPGIIVWENVPGVLSAKDNAFGCFLGALAGESCALEPPGGKWTNAGYVRGPSRSIAWRILDAQYFGVAQRRRRVFVVASARNDIDPAAILFEREGVRRDSAPSRETRQETTGDVDIGAYAGNAEGGALDLPFLTCSNIDSHFNNQTPLIVNFMAFPANLSATQCATSVNLSPAMGAKNPTAVAYPIHDQATRHAGKRGENNDGKGNGLGIGSEIYPAPTLTKGDRHGVAYAFDACPINTQMATRGAETSNTPREGIGVGKPGDPAFTLQAAHHHAVQHGMAVRRLTPVECERLQGFPDGWTDIKPNGKPTPDGPRYKALGNSMAVPVMRWIGERIQEAVS